MFRAFGHKNSSVLDGGLARWEAEGYPLDVDKPTGKERTLYPTPVFDGDTIRSGEYVYSMT
jgi:thiosulfate/3-mercaptopyruvate sulfurtransferase